MNAQLDDMAGAILRRSVEALGILVHTSKRTTEVRTDENGRLAGIVFSDGSSIDCDMLVIAAGIRPERRPGPAIRTDRRARDRRRRPHALDR